jgi:hypothetical protein
MNKNNEMNGMNVLDKEERKKLRRKRIDKSNAMEVAPVYLTDYKHLIEFYRCPTPMMTKKKSKVAINLGPSKS